MQVSVLLLPVWVIMVYFSDKNVNCEGLRVCPSALRMAGVDRGCACAVMLVLMYRLALVIVDISGTEFE